MRLMQTRELIRSPPRLRQGSHHEGPQTAVAPHVPHATEAGNQQRFGVVGLQCPQRAAYGAQGRRRLAPRELRRCKVIEGHDEVRVDLERALIARDGFVDAALAIQSDTEIVVRLGKVGLQGDRPAVAVDCLVWSPEALQNVAKVDQRLEIGRREVQRLAVARSRGFQSGEVDERVAEIAQCLGVVRLDGESLTDQLYGKIGATRLKGSDTKKMQAVGVSGGDGENLAILALRFNQPSGLMVPDRFGKNPLDVRSRYRARHRLWRRALATAYALPSTHRAWPPPA